MALGRGDRGIDVEAGGVVAWGGLDQHQGRRRDDEHEERREQETAKQERQEPAVHDGVFGSKGARGQSPGVA